MNVIHEKTDNGEVVLTVEVDDDQYDRHLTSASRRLSQRFDIPGFRKGKAPRVIVQSFVGIESLAEEALKSLVPEVVNEAIQQEDIDAFATPKVEVEELEPAVKIKATVPLMPSIKIGDYKSVRVDDQPEEITDETVDDAIERLRRTQSYLEPVDRAAKIDDVVTMSINAVVGDRVVLDVEDREVLLRENVSVPFENFYEEVAGLSAGGERSLQLTVPDELRDEEIVGKTADVQIKVSGVKQEVLPPLDDGLAALYNEDGVTTLLELRAHLQTALEESAEARLMRELETKVVDAIADVSEVEISPIIIEREGQYIIQSQVERHNQLLGNDRSSAIDVDDIPSETYEQAETEAKARIRRSLVMSELVKLEDVEVTDEEISAEIERTNEFVGPDREQLEDTEENRESVASYLRNQRALTNVIMMARGLSSEDEVSEHAPPSD